VTIRTEEAEVPSEFPPARLFLDDIEEIVRILVVAAENRKREGNLHEDPARTRLTLTVKDRVCDEVQELPKIAKKTINLSVKVERQYWSQTFLRFSRYGTSLGFYGVTREEQLSTFYNLAPIFKRRNLWLATLVRPHRTLILTLVVLLTLAPIALIYMIIHMLDKHTARMLAMASIVMSLFTMAISTTFLATNIHHSIIILRPWSEPSPPRQDLLSKILPVAIGCSLTFLLTLLGMYLKHKYWP
jgi:hypothetical protein